MPDRILQGWFKAVALAARNPPLLTPHTLNEDAKAFIKNLHKTIEKLNDKKICDEAGAKGYEDGLTASSTLCLFIFTLSSSSLLELF